MTTISSAKALKTTNPATGKPLESFEHFTAQQFEKKLASAASAAKSWASKSIDDRSVVLLSVAEALRSEKEALSQRAVREMGKPIAQARAEVEKCAWCCEYFGKNAASMLADIDVKTDAARSFVAFRPLGVVLAIMPWNFPYWQVIRAAAPALMAGNALLLKHAEITTGCGLELERIFHEAGAPDGLFSALLVSNQEADDKIADSRISAVTLTGSERAGVAVATAAGQALKKCVLELGGSDAFVVLKDADLEKTAKMAVKGRFQNNGQSCIAAKRFIVEAPVHDEFVRLFVEAAKAQKVGDPMEDSTEIGPVARGDLRDTLHEQVTETVAAGGKLLLGGKPIEREGYYYEPTIVDEVKPGMRMFDEEVFGPAAAVIVARGETDAIELANNSSYGLGFSIWTKDTGKAQRIAAKVEAGSVFINAIVASDPRLPFGGVKKSGYGRELSSFGIHEFVNIQTVWVSDDKPSQGWGAE